MERIVPPLCQHFPAHLSQSRSSNCPKTDVIPIQERVYVLCLSGRWFVCGRVAHSLRIGQQQEQQGEHNTTVINGCKIDTRVLTG